MYQQVPQRHKRQSKNLKTGPERRGHRTPSKANVANKTKNTFKLPPSLVSGCFVLQRSIAAAAVWQEMFLRSGRTHYYECSPTKKQYWLSLILPRPVKKAKKSSINKWFWWGFLKAELVSCGIGFKWYLFRRPFISALRQPHFLETHFQNHFFEIHHFYIIHSSAP